MHRGNRRGGRGGQGVSFGGFGQSSGLPSSNFVSKFGGNPFATDCLDDKSILQVDFNTKINGKGGELELHSFMSIICPNLFEVPLTAYDCETLKVFRSLLYSGKLKVNQDVQIVKVMEICLTLVMKNLVEICYHDLSLCITVKNFAELYSYEYFGNNSLWEEYPKFRQCFGNFYSDHKVEIKQIGHQHEKKPEPCQNK
jgi:hypothetical protein